MDLFFDFPIIITGLVLAVALLFVGFIVGGIRERHHLADIERRDHLHAGFPVYDIALTPPGMQPSRGELVLGHVVIASDHFKEFVARWKSRFGGELKSFVSMVERGKAEARLRMIESARQQGAMAVINVRFETSEIGGGVDTRAGRSMSEVLCYGTAIFE